MLRLPKPHFALVLAKRAWEAWGIGLIGQRLPLRTQSITLVLRWRHPVSSMNNGSQPARERTLPLNSRKNKTRGSFDAKKQEYMIGFSNIQTQSFTICFIL